ncbi:hypothetical protein FRC12_003173 [Ceratobasidium sp. 428]|nr:hypothetical protein FRC12_003173 [Ceratobasidium sp. 428]
MPEFTQVESREQVSWDTLVDKGYLKSRLERARDILKLQKYTSDPVEQTCSFLITDTISVWAEGTGHHTSLLLSLIDVHPPVLDSKHTSHRARHAHSARGHTKRGFALPYHDADEEGDWRRGVVQTLGEVHETAMVGSVEFEVKESEAADLSVYISDASRDFHWRWDVMSVGRMAGEILSKQLFMPLVTLAAVTSSLGQSADDASEETLRTVSGVLDQGDAPIPYAAKQVTERKASTAKVMPAHHLRGFVSRSSTQTVLRCIAQVDAAPKYSGYDPPAAKLAATPSVDMADPDESPGRDSGLRHRVPTSSSGDSLGRSGGLGPSRKGKGRDDTDDEDDGAIRKMRRGATPRRSDIPGTETHHTLTTGRSSFTRPQPDPDSTSTEGETTNNSENNSCSQTMDEDIGPPAAASSQPPPPPSPRPTGASPKSARPSPHAQEKPRSARAPPRAPVDKSDVFGATQTQAQASSDDSDREAELARRVRAAGAIGSAAVRTPAGGGLGSRMARKRF